jgi:hypothetical protein
MECPHLIAQWTDVSFQGRQSIVHTKIVEVELGRGSLVHWIPLRVFIADPGQPGDSGALLRDAQGKGVAIYMGGVHNSAGTMEGFGQHLGQVADDMDLIPLY